MIDLVVFDFEGTLVDSAAHSVRAMQAAFMQQALVPPSPAAVRAVIGLADGPAIARLHRGGDAASHARLLAVYRLERARLAALTAPLAAGVEEALDALSRAGLLLAIATGKSRAGLRAALASCGIARHFDALRTADDCPAKPDPAMLREILDEFGVAPSRAIMVGDADVDLRMAAAAGMRAIGVTGGAHPAERLLDCRPLALIDGLPALPSALRELAAHPARRRPCISG